MTGTIEIVFMTSLITLTIIFVVVGIWLALALKELRRLMKNINKTADDFQKFTSKLNQAADFAGGVAGNVRQSLEIASLVRNFFKSKKNGE